jgi:membrane-bound metal-dependent hydrolase YbcI (DUF457 family)
MFIGHFGTGFAVKKISKNISVGTSILAAQFIDILWPLFLLLGLESVKIEPGNTAFTPLNFIHYPFTHSLFAVLLWALLFGGVTFLIGKNKLHSIIFSLLVLSHWVLDLITHRPDLLLFPWSEFKVGFGLWNNIAATIIVEGFIFLYGSYLLIQSIHFKSKKGLYVTVGLILFLSIIYIMNVFGPPPPSEEPISYIGLAQIIFVVWGYYIDKLSEL